jgi:hypothetical protein
MFNDAGCTNTKPDSIINNASVYKYSKSSKRYIQNDLENAVKLLQSKIRNKDDDARILCHGRDPNKICDNFKNDSLAVSKECMIEMFNDAGCPNKLPSNTIDDTFVLNNSTLTKNRLKTYMNFFTEKIKTLADNKDDIGSDINLANRIICYGRT